MHPRTLTTLYASARHHEPLPQFAYPTFHHHNVSAFQTLASLHGDVKRLQEAEHFLQKQIHRYRSSLEDVQAVLYAKINRANEMQNFLAPVSRLPNEMLLAIFEEAVACQDPGAEQRVEFTISKVSRRWRNLAIHSPRLWRRVTVTPRIAAGMLELYKTRGSRALDIEIWGWKDRRDFQKFDAALEKMLDSSGRWRSLSIACVCDTHLSHLTLKLSHVGHFPGLKHFTFRALRPGQTCSVSFLMESAAAAQSHSPNQAQSLCTLKSLDAENFILTGDLGSIHARATQNFARLSSLTLRRYSNDARSFRIMIDFSAFRAMLSVIPNLTTLVLHGQPLRFRTDPVVGLQGQVDFHGSGIGIGGGMVGAGATASSTPTIALPHLHTLVLHPGVLKPRYLQQTISAIHAPALRHFELVFPDSKISGQNVVERLFLDGPPLTSTSSLSSSSLSSLSATDAHMNKRRPRFPRVETLVLNNASNAGTAFAFIHAFPLTTQATLGGVDVGFFPLVLHAGAESGIGAETRTDTSVRAGADVSLGTGVGPPKMTEPGSRSGIVAEPESRSRSGSGISRTCACDCNCARVAYWHGLRTLTLRQPRLETLRVLVDWIHNERERGHVVPMLVVEGSIERHDIRHFVQRARMYTKVEAVEPREAPVTAAV